MRSAFVLIAAGLLLSACSNFPGFGGDPVKVSMESTPPGAMASLSSGGSCRTPCTLPAPDKTGDYNVTYGLTGYTTQTVPVKINVKKENWYSGETTTVEPNPVTATLQPAKAPPQTRPR